MGVSTNKPTTMYTYGIPSEARCGVFLRNCGPANSNEATTSFKSTDYTQTFYVLIDDINFINRFSKSSVSHS